MLLMDMEPQIQLYLQSQWGQKDWRVNLLNERVNGVLNLNMRLLEDLHSMFTRRQGRPAFVKPGDFCLDDAHALFKEARIKNFEG